MTSSIFDGGSPPPPPSPRAHAGDDHGAPAESHAAAAGAVEGGPDDKSGPVFNASGFSDEIFDTSVTFASMGLRETILKGLTEAGFVHPTKIQALMIPRMLAGQDVLGQARTGTGKTGAFGLPLIHMCDRDAPTQALVLVPTRELCLQVTEEINTLARLTPIRACAVYGGDQIRRQAEALKKRPQIIVSTPGRLMDMVERGYVNLSGVRFAILDEVDRMLDIGFRDDIRKIFRMCPPPGPKHEGGRQSIFVSATLPPDVERLARSHANNPEKVIAVVEGPLTNQIVKQWFLPVKPWDKRRLLYHLLKHEEPDLTLVFCRMKRTVDDLSEYLAKKGIDVLAMHGDMRQSKRMNVMDKLHKGELSVVVASDLASRGIDVDGITHVVNYDLPDDPEVYVHRIGRTARIGREGVAWSLVTPEQGELLTSIESLINTEIPQLQYPDFVPSEPPGGRRDSAPAPKPREQVNRVAASAAPPIPPVTKVIDASKFPGGIVPSKLPPNRMFGKMKTSDSLKASAPPPPTPDKAPIVLPPKGY